MTALEKRCAKAVRDWCEVRDIELTEDPLHLHARGYVIAQPAPMALVVVIPWVDSEPQCSAFDKENGSVTVHKFDKSLRVGMWRTTAYVVSCGTGESIAIPVVR